MYDFCAGKIEECVMLLFSNGQIGGGEVVVWRFGDCGFEEGDWRRGGGGCRGWRWLLWDGVEDWGAEWKIGNLM